MSSSDASPTPNGDRLKRVFKGLKPKGGGAEARAERLLTALENTAFGLILDSQGSKDDLRAFAAAFGREKLELHLSAAGPDALTELAGRLEPKRRRFPKLTGELVEIAMKKLGSVKEPKEKEPGFGGVPSRDAIFAMTSEKDLRTFLEALPQELIKKIRLEHGLMYSALPPPKDKKGEIEHIVASVFRKTQGSILDQMDFAPRARSGE